MTGSEQTVLLEPDDGSLGPLLRVAHDRLVPGERYGVHDHRAVDVVAVVLAGGLRHEWGGGAGMRAGQVAVLRAGTGLEHDECAGPDGARVLQCFLRATAPDEPPSHEVLPGDGWVDLRRPDARLWIGPPEDAPDGLVLAVHDDRVEVGGDGAGASSVVVWQTDTARPDWATG